MGFLSNIYSTIKSGISTASSYLSNLYKPEQNTAMVFPVGQGLSPESKMQAESVLKGQSGAYDPYIPPVNYTPNINYSPYTPPALPYTAPKPLSSNYTSQVYYKPATTVNPNQSTQSTAPQTAPQTQPVSPPTSYKTPPPPPQAASGQAGVGYQSVALPYSAGQLSVGGQTYIPPVGATGEAGGSSARNAMGGSLGTNTITQPSLSPEEQQKTRVNKILSAQRTTKPFVVPTANGQLDINKLITQGADIVSRFKGGTLDTTTKQQFIDAAHQAIQQATEQINQMKAIPDEPMIPKDILVENPEQQNILKQTPLQNYEDLQRELGIPDLIKKYETNLSQVQAATDIFNKVIKDIQDNPNLPKGLALVRMREAQNIAGNTIQSLKGQAEILRTQLEFKQNELKDRIGISERAKQSALTQQNQTRDDARSQLQMFISTGSLGDLSPQDLLSISKATGFTPDSIAKMASAVKSGNETKIAKAQADLAKIEAQIAKTEADKGTVFEQRQNQIPAIEKKLLASKKGGEFVDGNVYN